MIDTFDMSDHTVRVLHEDVEKMICKELRDSIKCHKEQINELEKQNVDPEHDDLVYSKSFIRAAAIVLKWYTVPSEWTELDEWADEISNGK